MQISETHFSARLPKSHPSCINAQTSSACQKSITAAFSSIKPSIKWRPSLDYPSMIPSEWYSTLDTSHSFSHHRQNAQRKTLRSIQSALQVLSVKTTEDASNFQRRLSRSWLIFNLAKILDQRLNSKKKRKLSKKIVFRKQKILIQSTRYPRLTLMILLMLNHTLNCTLHFRTTKQSSPFSRTLAPLF